MKNMRKLLAMALAVLMVMSLATTAFAADADLSGHTYKAYQIFAGTQSTDDDSTELGNITWGSGIDGAGFLAALQADETIGSVFTDCTTAIDVAEAITGWADDNDNARAFAKIAYSYITGEGVSCVNGETTLDAGYYLVVDVTENVSGSAYNLALLQLTKKGDFEIANKTDVPEFIKKVDDKNDSNTSEDETVWEDSADYDIGDQVPFKLEATLADNVATYSNYKVIFHDNMTAGLTFNAESVKVYVDGNLISTGYEVKTENTCSESCTFEVVIANVKAVGAGNSSVITVLYTAELNKNAVLGAPGNPNYAQLEYSNNPNWTGNGQPGETPDEPTGKTPEDKVIVFTYKVIVNKVRQDGVDAEDKPVYAPLPGAVFTLQKWVKDGENDAEGKPVGHWVDLKTVETKPDTTFTFEGLDDGWYRLTEEKAPDGYNSIDPIHFDVTAEHDVKADDPQLIKLEGSQTTKDGPNTTSGDLGTFEIVHNKLAGSLTTDILNLAGVELPETGGMGTTLIYTAGAVMVVLAVVLLITKKRMAVEK